MKPIIIYPKITKYGNVIISKEDFEKIINDVYEQGKSDGDKQQMILNPITYPSPNTTPYAPIITCETGSFINAEI